MKYGISQHLFKKSKKNFFEKKFFPTPKQKLKKFNFKNF